MMTKLFVILCILIISPANASEYEDFMRKQEMHFDASKKLFRSENPDEIKKAYAYLQKETDEGSAYSAGKIGWAYQLGRGTEKDLKKAKELYLHAANRGMTYWQFLLAHAYQQGYLEFDKSDKEYKYWLNYEPKVHIAYYECWVLTYYDMGIFPTNEYQYKQNEITCNERVNKAQQNDLR